MKQLDKYPNQQGKLLVKRPLLHCEFSISIDEEDGDDDVTCRA